MRAARPPPPTVGARPPPRCRPAPPPPAASPTAVADFAAFLSDAQEGLLAAVEALDGSGATFRRDAWSRDAVSSPNPGAGVTAVLEGGALIEKGAASTTTVGGRLSPARAAALAARGVPTAVAGAPYAAAALSLVFHTRNPHVPVLRGDVRAFECDGVAWFGGGADLTPSYLYADDAAAFHAHWKGVCDAHDGGGGGALYEALKAECDAYFYIPARGEHRGVGGIFFDGAPAAPGAGGGGAPAPPAPPASPLAAVDGAAFAADVLAGWLPSWAPIAERRRGVAATDAEREWQLLRRGRYVEFNLVYDRGVRFGLDGGRVEAVMVSAPPLVRWAYDVKPAPGSREAELEAVLASPRAWV